VARRLTQLSTLPVSVLKGVGDKRTEALESMGISSVLELLWHYPRRYVDRSQQISIPEIAPGTEALVLGHVRRIAERRSRQGRTMVEAVIDDGSGSLRVTFFNQPWRVRQLSEGTEAAWFGKVDDYRGSLQMVNPLVDRIGDRTGRIVPLYPQSEKARVTSWELARWIEEALERAGEFADPLGDAERDELSLTDRSWAMRHIHQPQSMHEVTEARRRLAFDELLRVQLLLVSSKLEAESTASGREHVVDGPLLKQFLASLPYQLTAAQQRVIEEINGDLTRRSAMHRLLQGDVGGGKTVVAVAAMLAAVDGGHQAALMAPTEVLAEQHAQSIQRLLNGLEVRDESALTGSRPLQVKILTGSANAAQRRDVLQGLADGSHSIVVGTHALLTESVEFHDLGVIVVDEQHRFGVEQRASLRGKGALVDTLVMTATPIPRTAALAIYGDLDLSILDELPPGRTPIRTTRVGTEEQLAAMWARVHRELTAGRQVYVVCPLVEDSPKVEASSAEATFEDLAANELSNWRVALLHGRTPSVAKEATMQAFRDHQIDVLVATTVIEVGVDVPNATVMVILDSERFGIAQLHQLRGRVGRGSQRSYCFLTTSIAPEEASPRIDALVDSTDGFYLAEVDLELRGEGALFSTRQKGYSDLRLASLRRDRDLVEAARAVAFDLLSPDWAAIATLPLSDELAVLTGVVERDGGDTDLVFEA